jgi:glyceraldehyde 3-phosphate dehydrogenase
MQDNPITINSKVNESLENWRNKEKLALELLKVVGDLRFDKSIDLVIFRTPIYDTQPSKILSLHQYSQNYDPANLAIELTLALAKSIQKIKNLNPAKIDLGTLGLDWIKEKENFSNTEEFVHDKLRTILGQDSKLKENKDIVLYGFGRIGRLAARLIINQTGRGDQLRLKAIVIRPKLKDHYEEAVKRASLLKDDTVHGTFSGHVEVSEDGKEMVINGNIIKIIYASSPEEIDYTSYGIHNAMVIDNTGVWRNKKELSIHLRPGVEQVLLTAPGKDIPNIVLGANHQDYDLSTHSIISAASCTTNAIAPVLKVIHENYGITNGHIETIHAYTNDQNLVDNFHKKSRRGRGAPTNMVITTTGAAKAVAKVLPDLNGILTGNAIRVPIPNVSLAILNLTLKNSLTLEELNAKLKEASLYGPYVDQIQFSSSTEFVSSNAIGASSTGIIDAPSTIVSGEGKQATIYVWYDNEYGYTCQVVRLAKIAAKVRRHIYN